MKIRALHLDLKGVPPTADRLVRLLHVAAASGYNTLLVEWEDSFPWTVDRRFRSKTAYTPREVERFHSEAAPLGLEVIPLVQCLGHMETPLGVNALKYHRLREVADSADCLNPLAPGARDLVLNMVLDVLAVTPGLRHFHLGGDEAWLFGRHRATKAFIRKHGRAALYLYHVEPVLDMLNSRDIRPVLWHDMMRDWDDDSLRRLGRKADLVLWGYRGHPDKMGAHCNPEMIQRLLSLGVTLWGACAYKGADGEDRDLPDLSAREQNALGWADAARKYGLAGVVATAWSRYATHREQNEPIDACLDSLVNVGAILHDGEPVDNGLATCVSHLDRLGEGRTFRNCRDAMAQLAEARRRAWTQVRVLSQLIVTAADDPRRRNGSQIASGLNVVRQEVSRVEAAAKTVSPAFRGLIEPVWIKRYLNERVQPLRDQIRWLQAAARKVKPPSPR
jgi:hexosaminidase